MDSIDTSIDEEDRQAVTSAESGYDSSFTGEFGSKVKPIEQGIKTMSQENVTEANTEAKKVSDAGDKFRQMESISDVGRSAASSGESQMRRSEADYKKLADEAKKLADERTNALKGLESDISGIFK